MGNWKENLVYPDYGFQKEAGKTIANIGPTIAKLFDVPFQGLPPVNQHFIDELRNAGPIDRVVLIILDAMGANLMDDHPQVQALADRATAKETITSVFPSTTVNALSSIWTGHSPGQHGLVG